MRNSIENYIIDNIANFAGSRISEEEKKAKVAKIKQYSADLSNLIQYFDNTGLFFQTQERTSRLQNIIQELAQNNSSKNLNYDFNKSLQNYKEEELKLNLVKSYLLIEALGNELGFITHTSFTFFNTASFSSDFRKTVNFDYNNEDDIKKLTNMVKLVKNSKNGLQLKFHQAEIANLIGKNKENSFDILLREHYQNFIKPFQEYENNNKTGWQINQGVAVEAFERHLEQTKEIGIDGNGNYYFIKKPSHSNRHLKSNGDRWGLYIASSGSDPFWTGPDTKYSQVKGSGSALIGNITSIRNALQLWQNFLTYQYVSNADANRTIKRIKSELSQSPAPKEINDKIYDEITKDTKEVFKGLNIKNATGFTKTKNAVIIQYIDKN